MTSITPMPSSFPNALGGRQSLPSVEGHSPRPQARREPTVARYSILKCELTQNRQKVAKAQDEVGHKCPRSNAEVIFQEFWQALFPKFLPEGLIFELEAGF